MISAKQYMVTKQDNVLGYRTALVCLACDRDLVVRKGGVFLEDLIMFAETHDSLHIAAGRLGLPMPDFT